MNWKLQRIANWPERAYKAQYRVGALAEQCGVSVRSLERHIKLYFGQCPQMWLRELVMQRAKELLPESESVKAVALELGYTHAHHFSRDFKKHTGFTPHQFQLGVHGPPPMFFAKLLQPIDKLESVFRPRENRS